MPAVGSLELCKMGPRARAFRPDRVHESRSQAIDLVEEENLRSTGPA